jgi:peptidoglycan/LPS O-acetylase OafA/YrhL
MSLENRKAAGIRYRPDVDGLRAVAVLMVFADHLDTKLSGGYVGVDVFFVISGYLIGAMILAEMREGRFSVARFYERRLKRIFPAMLAMMLGVTVLACIYLIPSETVAYTRSLLAALFSGSNFLFWHEGGYFDIPGLKPLLHTWSLGVEEQFYILFPLFLMFVRRWLPNRFRAAILWVALISFIAACITVRNHPVAAFYFAPLRAWELLLGTIVSQRYVPWPRTAVTRNIASLLGLALIVAPGFLYTSDTPFPGVTALAPCLGTALIIAAGETGASLVGSVLAWRPVVFVGLISYSLYLWHWPIIVFQNGNGIFVHSDILTRKVKIVLIVVAFVVSTLSWRFVEQPFRKGPLAKNHKAIFSITGGVSLAIVLVSVALLLLRGLPQRFTPESLAIAEYQADIHVPTAGCFLTPDKSFADFSTSTCLRSTPGKPSILVAGDSHSDMLMPGLVVVYPDRDLMQASTSNCPALVTYSGRPPSENCRRLFGFLYNDYLKQAPPGVTLVLAARWREEDLPDIGATVDYVRSLAIPIVIVGPSIEFDKPEARTLAFAVRDGHLNEMPGHLLTAPRALDREMAEAARSVWHAPYVSIFDDLCTPACPIFAAKDVALDYDHNHLTQQGAVLLARAMREKKELP